MILRLPNGDQVYFTPGIGDNASLAWLLELELPNGLPNGLKVASTMRMKVWYGPGNIQRHWALMKVSFVIPADLQNFEFAILFWDKAANSGAGGWVEVTSFRVQDSLNGVQIERQEAWVDQTGIYILVIRSSP